MGTVILINAGLAVIFNAIMQNLLLTKNVDYGIIIFWICSNPDDTHWEWKLCCRSYYKYYKIEIRKKQSKCNYRFRKSGYI